MTEEEARENEEDQGGRGEDVGFDAKNVRDFGWASSRKFIWDAMAVKVGNKTPLAMSYYPKEGNPLWEQYSTKAVAQTLKTYSEVHHRLSLSCGHRSTPSASAWSTR